MLKHQVHTQTHTHAHIHTLTYAHTHMYIIHALQLGPRDACSSGPQLRYIYHTCKQLPFRPIRPTYCHHHPSGSKIFAYQNFGCLTTACKHTHTHTQVRMHAHTHIPTPTHTHTSCYPPIVWYRFHCSQLSILLKPLGGTLHSDHSYCHLTDTDNWNAIPQGRGVCIKTWNCTGQFNLISPQRRCRLQSPPSPHPGGVLFRDQLKLCLNRQRISDPVLISL